MRDLRVSPYDIEEADEAITQDAWEFVATCTGSSPPAGMNC